MNTREKRKHDRIQMLKKIMERSPKETDENLISLMIVNQGISRKLAIEEINAVRNFLDAK